jgi:hypothetical protein
MFNVHNLWQQHSNHSETSGRMLLLARWHEDTAQTQQEHDYSELRIDQEKRAARRTLLSLLGTVHIHWSDATEHDDGTLEYQPPVNNTHSITKTEVTGPEASL